MSQKFIVKCCFFASVVICLCWPGLSFSQEWETETITETIPHLDNPQKQVEFYALRPTIKAKLPLIIFVHGYQDDKMGAKKVIEDGTLAKIGREGYFMVSVSQPGFGKSSGPADYCGPFTQRAVITVIQYLKAKYPESIDPSKIVLWGMSRGAIVVSNIATQEKGLAGLILNAGLYDMKASTYKGFVKNLTKEAGTEPDYIEKRSAILSANNIKIPVLMLHGYYDERAPIQQAIQFYETIMKAEAKATLIIFPNGHFLPGFDSRMFIKRFLKNLFEKKYDFPPVDQKLSFQSGEP